MNLRHDRHRRLFAVATLSGLMAFTLAAQAQAPAISGKPLPEPAREVLAEILREAGVAAVEVTSVARTPAKQAEVMYGYIVRNGAAAAHKLYGPAGDRVIDVYEQHAGKPKDEVVALMLERLEVEFERLEAQGDKRTELMHVSDSHYVFDVAPSSIPASRHAAFEKAVENHPKVSRFLKPPLDKNAYHIEVPKD